MSRRSSLERLPPAVRAAAAAAIGDGRRLARQMPPIAAKMLLYAVIYRYMSLYVAICRYMSLYVAISRHIPVEYSSRPSLGPPARVAPVARAVAAAGRLKPCRAFGIMH